MVSHTMAPAMASAIAIENTDIPTCVDDHAQIAATSARMDVNENNPARTVAIVMRTRFEVDSCCFGSWVWGVMLGDLGCRSSALARKLWLDWAEISKERRATARRKIGGGVE